MRLPQSEPGVKVGLDDYLVAHGAESLKTLLDAAVDPVRPSGGRDGTPDNRIEVLLSTKEFVVVNETIEALAARDDGLFSRGEQLVHVVRDSNPKSRVIRPVGDTPHFCLSRSPISGPGLRRPPG